MRPTSPWAPYRPDAGAPWDLARAWTLRRRAGFAATWRELQRDLLDGPESSVDRVLAGTCRSEGVPPDFEPVAGLLGDGASASADARRLQAWWLYRALFTPHPLRERATLMWHDHFATSQLKVDDVAAMKAQNETFRRLALGPFGDLLRDLLRDPALLAWLDAPSNRKGRPNENLARELMELFTLGVGHYSEPDVKEAARALTGRTVAQGRYAFRPHDHDDGEKTLFGRPGRLDGDSLADRLLEHPGTANRLAWRLCSTFLGEGVADAGAIADLGDRLRRDDLHVGRGVETILRSSLFHSDKNLHTRVSDPVGFVVGSSRALERFRPPPSTLLLAEWTGRLGQELFFPPNVGGWPGGRAWLTGRGVVARANFAASLAEGRLNSDATPPHLGAIAADHGRASGPSESIRFFGELLTGRAPSPALTSSLWQATSGLGPDTDRLDRAVALLLARPESQLA